MLEEISIIRYFVTGGSKTDYCFAGAFTVWQVKFSRNQRRGAGSKGEEMVWKEFGQNMK